MSISFKSIIRTVAIAAVLCSFSRDAGAEKHWVPGMSTYGVSNAKRTCSVCGTTYTAGEGHMCERPDRTSHSSYSSSSSSSSSYSSGYMPVASYPCQPNGSYSSSSSSSSSYGSSSYEENMASRFSVLNKAIEKKKKARKTKYTIITICLIAGAGYLFWRRRNK